MGWICISDNCIGHIDSITGKWDGTGIAYFSIKDELFLIHEKIFAFLASITPAELLLILIFFIVFFVAAMFVSVRMAYHQAVDKGS